MHPLRIIAAALVAALLLVACGDDARKTTEPEPTTASNPSRAEVLAAVGEPTGRYDDPALWVCRGVTRDDVCTGGLATTEIARDGTSKVVPRSARRNPPADCFYVYPTVDLRQEPGNATLADTSDAELMVRQQAAPFSSLCRVFAPLYEQATIGTYRLRAPVPPDLTAPELATAYAQVLDAFRWYMANENDGRPIVLLGHSQGSDHLARLVGELFDTTPALADQLVVALLVGAGGFAVNVPDGELTGGTLARIPLCTTRDETGCVVAYNSYAATSPPPGPWWTSGGTDGTRAACVDPAELAHGTTTVTASTFDYPLMGFDGLTTDLSGLDLGAVATRLVTYPSAYDARCVSDGTETWLRIAPAYPDDPRPRIPIDNASMSGLGLGLHLLDYQLLAGDLHELTEAKIDAATGARAASGPGAST